MASKTKTVTFRRKIEHHQHRRARHFYALLINPGTREIHEFVTIAARDIFLRAHTNAIPIRSPDVHVYMTTERVTTRRVSDQ